MSSDNQTLDEDLEGMEPGARGTGIFAVADPEQGVFGVSKIFVDGLTYEECVQRGTFCLSYRWMRSRPDRFARQLRAGPPKSCTTNKDCTDPACICQHGKCV